MSIVVSGCVVGMVVGAVVWVAAVVAAVVGTVVMPELPPRQAVNRQRTKTRSRVNNGNRFFIFFSSESIGFSGIIPSANRFKQKKVKKDLKILLLLFSSITCII